MPAKLAGRPGGKGGVQIGGDGEDGARHILGVDVVRSHDRRQQFLRCGENLLDSVGCHGGGPADASNGHDLFLLVPGLVWAGLRSAGHGLGK